MANKVFIYKGEEYIRRRSPDTECHECHFYKHSICLPCGTAEMPCVSETGAYYVFKPKKDEDT